MKVLIRLITICVLAGACGNDPPPPPTATQRICEKALPAFQKLNAAISLLLWQSSDAQSDAFCTRVQLGVKGASSLLSDATKSQLQPTVDKLTAFAAKCTPATAAATRDALKLQLERARTALEKTCAK